MSTHRRGLLRAAAAAALQGLPTTGDRVTASRVYPDHLVEAGPALSVYLDEGAVDPDGLARGAAGELNQDRVDALVVECRVLETTANLDALLDASAWEVERAIALDPYLGGHARWTELASLDVERDADREKPLAVQSHTFRVEYVVDARDPQ